MEPAGNGKVFVVDDKGKKYSDKPIPKWRAKKQMAALYQAEPEKKAALLKDGLPASAYLVVEDPQKGLEALSKAIEAGFKDAIAAKALLDSPSLLERQKVEGILAAASLMSDKGPAQTPESKPAASPPGGQTAAP